MRMYTNFLHHSFFFTYPYVAFAFFFLIIVKKTYFAEVKYDFICCNLFNLIGNKTTFSYVHRKVRITINKPQQQKYVNVITHYSNAIKCIER